MEIYTIGFTKKTASQFFGTLRRASIQQLIDIRLNNVSQLAGFSKRDDLAYFLKQICGIEYKHELLLAPTEEMLDNFKKAKGRWETYEDEFLALIEKRQIEKKLPQTLFWRRTVLLCSEETSEHCHRRLVVEYLKSKWGNVRAKHL